MKFVKMPALVSITEKMIEGPESEGEEDIWGNFKKSVIPLFHFGGTCRIGEVVDREFRVRGVEGLRVVDRKLKASFKI